jgi:prevent-host-death family protein
MVMIMTMIVVNIHEVKAKLSKYLDAVERGERVMICRRNEPVAELRAVEKKRTEPRPIGGGPHFFTVPDSFFEPMPEDWLDEFYSGPIFPEARKLPRVAESPAAYRSPAKRRRRK